MSFVARPIDRIERAVDYEVMLVLVLAALLTVPAVAYLGANLIEWAAGNEGGIGIFGDTFAQWSSLELTALVVGGPICAVALLFISSFHMRDVSREETGISATFELTLSRGRIWVAAVSSLLLAGTIAYGYANYWPCYYNGQSLCW